MVEVTRERTTDVERSSLTCRVGLGKAGSWRCWYSGPVAQRGMVAVARLPSSPNNQEAHRPRAEKVDGSERESLWKEVMPGLLFWCM